MLNNYTNPRNLQGGMGEAPLNKMGLKTTVNPRMASADSDLPYASEYATPYMHMIMTSEGVKPVQCRIPAHNECAIVDWVNFTIGSETFGDHFLDIDPDVYDEERWMEIIFQLEPYLEHIFGFSTTRHNPYSKNFYKQHYVLGDNMGFVCVGGQRNTLLIMLSGTGCTFAKEGWEKRLYTFLTTLAKRPKLTRIDLAHDDFEGKYVNVDWANLQDSIGGFQCSNRAPNVEHKGNWKRPNGRGRTIYVGSRESGKLLRGYEKGKHEGDPDDNWNRLEVEFKSSDRVLPFDMLLAPSDYLIGAYPCLSILDEHRQPQRIETASRTAQININSGIQNIQDQYGKYINVLRQIYSPEEIVSMICNPDPLSRPKRWEFALTSFDIFNHFRLKGQSYDPV